MRDEGEECVREEEGSEGKRKRVEGEEGVRRRKTKGNKSDIDKWFTRRYSDN